MTRLGRSDEVVVRDLECLPRSLVAPAHLVRPSLGADAVLLGRPQYLQAMLVGPGEEADVVADEAMPTSESIGDDRGVARAEMRRVVHVINRGRLVVAAGHCRSSLPIRYGQTWTLPRPSSAPV